MDKLRIALPGLTSPHFGQSKLKKTSAKGICNDLHSLAILITILLILLNGIFVAVEFAVVTSKKSKMQALAETGDRSARLALTL
ncbi:MAG: hypothetical protein Ct9H90mP30_6900 [Actinomycetota bacterium]|nr:MAG: hypothetical protein Ct9H90mP30_6900 [Actinomycetota bacterium]